MNIVLNGAPRALDRAHTVATLLDALGAPADGTAVAVNGRVVPRSDHATHPLAEGDRVEIIRAVGGG